MPEIVLSTSTPTFHCSIETRRTGTKRHVYLLEAIFINARAPTRFVRLASIADSTSCPFIFQLLYSQAARAFHLLRSSDAAQRLCGNRATLREKQESGVRSQNLEYEAANAFFYSLFFRLPTSGF